MALVAILQMCAKEFGKFEFVWDKRIFSIGGYIVCLGVISICFVIFLVRSFVNWIGLLFKNREHDEETKAISELANLIIADDYQFSLLYKKITLTDNLQALKIALALRRGFNIGKHFKKTGVSCIDIYIIRQKLQELIDAGEIQASVTLAEDAIENYAANVNVIKNELLEIATKAKQNDIKFDFEPSKFKYDLSSQYISEYDVKLKCVDFEMTSDFDKKFEILKKLHKEYTARIDVLCKLLEFYEKRTENAIIYDAKWVLKVIKETISMNPNRAVVPYLLHTGRNDIFELAQSMMANISNDNAEKNWILLRLAIEKKFNVQAKELAKRLIETDELNNVYSFITNEPRIVEIFQELRNDIKL